MKNKNTEKTNVPDNRDREENQTTKPDADEVSGSSDCSAITQDSPFTHAVVFGARETTYDPSKMKRQYGKALEDIQSGELGSVITKDGKVVARNIFYGLPLRYTPEGYDVSMIEHDGEYRITDFWTGHLSEDQRQSLQLDCPC